MTTWFPARAAGGLALAVAVLAAAGCGSKSKASGAVAGTVKYNGTPVVAGSVNFRSSTGAAAQAKIDDSGAYKIESLEAGEYQVYVSPPVPEPQPPGSKPAPPKKFEVSPKFRDPTTSGVTVTVKGGANDAPIEMKD